MSQAIRPQSRPAPWNKGKLIGEKLVFKKAAKLHRSETDVPHAVVDLFESDMLADAGDALPSRFSATAERSRLSGEQAHTRTN